MYTHTHTISSARTPHLISEHFGVVVHEITVALRADFILWTENSNKDQAHAHLNTRKGQGFSVFYKGAYVVVTL